MEMEVLLKKEETNWLLATDDGTILLIHDQNRTQRDTRSPPSNLETMKNSKNKQQSYFFSWTAFTLQAIHRSLEKIKTEQQVIVIMYYELTDNGPHVCRMTHAHIQEKENT